MNVDLSNNNSENILIEISSNTVNNDLSHSLIGTSNSIFNQLMNLPPIRELPESHLDISFSSPYMNWFNNPLISPNRNRISNPISFEFPPPTRSRMRRNRLLANAIGELLNIPTSSGIDIGGINSLTNRVLQQSLYQDPNSYKKVLSKKGKDSVLIKKYDDSYNEKKCPITCFEFKKDQEIAVLPCKHIFTPDSIFDWLENEKAECPICRFKLDSNEIKKDDNNELNFSNNLLTSLPPIPLFSNTNQGNSSINTDVDLQRAILRSIQNENQQENMESQETTPLIQENTPLIQENTETESNTFYFSFPIVQNTYEFNDDEWSNDDFDITSESESENISDQLENNSSQVNGIDDIDNQLEEIIDEIFDTIIEEEIV